MRAHWGRRVLVVALMSWPAPGHSDSMSHGYIVPFTGYTMFDRNMPIPHPRLDSKFDVGARAGWRLFSTLAIEGAADFGTTNENTVRGAKVRYLHASGNLAYVPFETDYGTPFVSLGLAFGQIKPHRGKIDQGNVEGAAGFDFRLNDRLGARVEVRDRLWLDKDKLTDVVAHTWSLGAGLTVSLAAPKQPDTDGDGVPDNKDKC